jgi:hypothetical protein
MTHTRGSIMKIRNFFKEGLVQRSKFAFAFVILQLV